MSKLVASAATELATRTSRRSFLARTGKVLLGLVGGAVAAGVVAETASAQHCTCPFFYWICSTECPSDRCPQDPAPQAYTCYACPNCDSQRCCCTGVTC
jgi:hypothetical protein